jgi:hypothetical protein
MPENPYQPPKEVIEPQWSPYVAYLKAAMWAVAVLALWVACYFAIAAWSFNHAGTGR